MRVAPAQKGNTSFATELSTPSAPNVEPKPEVLTAEEKDKAIGEAMQRFSTISEDVIRSGRNPVEEHFYGVLNRVNDEFGRTVAGSSLEDDLLRVAGEIRTGTRETQKYAGDIQAQVAFSVLEVNRGNGFTPNTTQIAQRGEDGTVWEVTRCLDAMSKVYDDVLMNKMTADGFRELCSEVTVTDRDTGELSGPMGVDEDGSKYFSYRMLPMGERTGATMARMDPSFSAAYTEVTKVLNNRPVGRPPKIGVTVRSSHSAHHRQLFITDEVLKKIGPGGMFDGSYGTYNTEGAPHFPVELSISSRALKQFSGFSHHVGEQLEKYGLKIGQSALRDAIYEASHVGITGGQMIMHGSEGTVEGVELTNGGTGCRRLTLKFPVEVSASPLGRPGASRTISIDIVASVLETTPFVNTIVGEVIFVITAIPNEVLMSGPYIQSNGAPIDPYGHKTYEHVVNIIPRAGDEMDLNAVALSMAMQSGDPWTCLRRRRYHKTMPITYVGIEFNHARMASVRTKSFLHRAVLTTVVEMTNSMVTMEEVQRYLVRYCIPTIGLGGAVWHPYMSMGNMRRYTEEDLLTRWAMCYLFVVGMGDGGSLHVPSLQRAQAAQIPPCIFSTCAMGWNVSAPMMLEAMKCGDKKRHDSAITEKIGRLKTYSSRRTASGGRQDGRSAAHPSDFGFSPRRTLVIAPMMVPPDRQVHGRSYTIDTLGRAWDHDLQIVEAISRLRTAVDRKNPSAEMVIWTPQYMLVVSLMLKAGGKLEGAAYLSTAARASAVSPTFHASKAVTPTEYSALRVHYASIGRPGAQGYMGGMLQMKDRLMGELVESDDEHEAV